MKRSVLLKKFRKHGWWILREGGSHTILTNGSDLEIIPRHREINERLALALISRWHL